MSGYLYPRCEQETLELYKDCLIYREGRAEFFLLLFLVFLRSTCRHSRARERNGTSMGVAGRLLKGLADDVGRGVKWVGADVVFSFSRVETFVPPPLLLILRSSLPAKHDQSLFPATTPSLSPFTSPSSGSSTTTPPSLFPLVPLPMMMTIIARDRTREPRHVCAKGIEDGLSFFLFRVSKTMDLGNETRLLYHTFIYYTFIYFIN